MKQKLIAIFLIILLSGNNILSTEINRRNKKSSKVKTNTREVDFTKWENLVILIGGFISYYFGFYDQFKEAQATFTCANKSIADAQKLITESFTSFATIVVELVRNCTPQNPIEWLGQAIGGIFTPDEKKLDTLAETLKGVQACATSAGKIITELFNFLKSAKELFDKFQKCMEDEMKNKTSNSRVTDLMIEAGKKILKTIADVSTGGLSRLVNFAQAVFIAIKFAIVCSKTDSEFKPEHKYRVLGKYLAQIVSTLFSNLRRARRRIMYRVLRQRMKKYKN